MRTLLVAGGSGGHLIPALSLAEDLQRDGAVFLLSTKRPVDQMLSERHGARGAQVEWLTVDLKKFTPLWRWFSPVYLSHQMRAFRKISQLMRQNSPDIVVGFGGYLSAAAAAVARRQRIPTVLHEQNLVPGRSNRWMARLSGCVAVSFPETKKYFSRRTRLAVTGNPIRSVLKPIDRQEARLKLGLDREKPTLLVMGGSQGSRILNDVGLSMWENSVGLRSFDVQVIHLTGEGMIRQAQETYRTLGVKAVVFGFLHEMEWAYAAADLAISRAGATTIAELAAWRLPSILVPYPHAGGHQRANARWLGNQGGALVLEEKMLTAPELLSAVHTLLRDQDQLTRMRENLRSSSNGSAIERLGALVRQMGSDPAGSDPNKGGAG